MAHYHKGSYKGISIKRNYLMNVILSMSSLIVPLITMPYVTRVLGPTGYGKASFAVSVVSYFLLFSQLGIPTYGVRTCASLRDNKELLTKTVRELLYFSLITTAVTYGILLVSITSVPRLRNDADLILISSIALLLNAIGMEWLYRALEQYTYITVRSIFFKIVAVLVLFLTVRSKNDVNWYCVVVVVSMYLSYILNYLHSFSIVDYGIKTTIEIKKHIKPVLIFFLMSCATTVYTHLDTVMLGFMASDSEVAFYTVSVRVKSILVSIITALSAVLLPRAAYLVNNDKKEEFLHLSRKSLSYVLWAAIPLSTFFIFFASDGVQLISGKAFSAAVPAMQVIMPTLIFIGITNVIGLQVLVPLGKENAVLISEIGGAVTDFILNIVFIPVFGAVGAAIGTLFAELVVLLIQLIYIHRSQIGVGRTDVSKQIVVTMVAIGLSLVIRNRADNGIIMFFFEVLLFFSTYVLGLLIVKDKTTKDIIQYLIGIKNN